MAEVRSIARSPTAASFVLGRKLDGIPFSAYHVLILGVLALVGFVRATICRSPNRCWCWPKRRCI